jgi:hypothetical protein
VGTLLLSLDDRRFWDLHDYPEIAELRAVRFGELGPNEKAAVTARIRKRPQNAQRFFRESDGLNEKVGYNYSVSLTKLRRLPSSNPYDLTEITSWRLI